MPELTQKQFASKGGKSRWQGKSSKERSDEMRRVAKVRWGKQLFVDNDKAEPVLPDKLTDPSEFTQGGSFKGRINGKIEYGRIPFKKDGEDN